MHAHVILFSFMYFFHVQPGTSDSSASQQPKVINVFISLMLIVQKQESLFLQQRMHHLFLIILGGH